MTRIYWLWDNDPSHFAPDEAQQDLIFGTIEDVGRRFARPGTEFVVDRLSGNVSRRPMGTYKYGRAFLAVEALERLRRAESDGFDAAFAGMCYGEFFLREARQAVRMPVVGPAESAMALAQVLGDRFAVVTVAPNFVHGITENIRMRGWQDRAIRDQPVRYWTPDFTTLMVDACNGRPERMIAEFEARALPAIEAGADVIICGCNPMGALFAHHGYHEVAGTGVPVIPPLPAMIKQAEGLADLHRSLGIAKSEAVAGPYRSTPADILEDMDAHGSGRVGAPAGSMA